MYGCTVHVLVYRSSLGIHVHVIRSWTKPIHTIVDTQCTRLKCMYTVTILCCIMRNFSWLFLILKLFCCQLTISWTCQGQNMYVHVHSVWCSRYSDWQFIKTENIAVLSMTYDYKSQPCVIHNWSFECAIKTYPMVYIHVDICSGLHQKLTNYCMQK